MTTDHVSRSSARRVFDVAAIVGFVAVVSAPSVDHFVRTDDARSVVRENRNAWPFPPPVTGFTTLSKFPVGFEHWFGDRLGMRDVLLRGYQFTRLRIFGAEPSPTMVVGKRDWLYFGSDDSVNVHRGVVPLDEAELVAFQHAIEERQGWLAEHGIAGLFVIAPDKQSIYPEFEPSSLVSIGPTRLDQLAAWMSAHNHVAFLDLRGALIAEKQRDTERDFVYHPLGSHWTSRGAWAAWNAIAEALRPSLPALQPATRGEYVRRERSEAESDSFAHTLYIGDSLHQGHFDFEPRDGARVKSVRAADGHVLHSDREGSSLPRAVFVHDSFGYWILPHAARSFAVMDAFWQNGFPARDIEALKPDVVIQLYTERMLRLGVPPFER